MAFLGPHHFLQLECFGLDVIFTGHTYVLSYSPLVYSSIYMITLGPHDILRLISFLKIQLFYVLDVLYVHS